MKMSMAGKPNSTSAMQMKSSLADADKAGNLYSAMGDISSGIGSLVLANQLSKKGG
jgi:hypothetical protein